MPFVNAIVAANDMNRPAPAAQLNADILHAAQTLMSEPPPNL